MSYKQTKVVGPCQGRANPFLKDNNKKYLTNKVFLIGNGNSRKDFDLERLRGRGTIIGCNALFRDFAPDILLAIDSKMIREIKDAEYSTEHNLCIIPTSRSVALPHAHKWKADRFNTTGCYAMNLIIQLMKPKLCYMLGMDNYKGNMYDDTPNYSINTLTNFGGVGSYYMRALQLEVGETKFINVNEKDTWPQEAHDTGNYAFIQYDEFEKTVMA